MNEQLERCGAGTADPNDEFSQGLGCGQMTPVQHLGAGNLCPDCEPTEQERKEDAEQLAHALSS